MFCTHCGSRLATDSRFCASCGAPIQAPEPLSQPELPPADLAPRTSPFLAPPERLAPFGIEPSSGLPYSHRSKVVAGLLQLFVGGLGVGRFYTGHIGMAIAQILVTVFTCGLGALWPIIDGIVILAGSPRDAEGRPLRE